MSAFRKSIVAFARRPKAVETCKKRKQGNMAEVSTLTHFYYVF